MSNGLVRMRSFDWLWDVRYVEHLIKDIKGKELVKCYSLPLFKHKLWKYVVVVTEEVARSLLFNWDHHQDLLKRDDIWWKPAKKFIERSFIKQFFLRMEDKNIVNRIITFGKHEEKILCAMNSPYPAIDFETKKLYHCAAYLQECQSVTMNMSNSKKLKECNLFDFDYYCRKCHVFDNDNKAQQILNCRRGNYKNVGKRYLGP